MSFFVYSLYLRVFVYIVKPLAVLFFDFISLSLPGLLLRVACCVWHCLPLWHLPYPSAQLAQYGEIALVSVVPQRKCAFVTFATRKSAESAISALFGKLVLGGVNIPMSWGKRGGASSSASSSGSAISSPYDGMYRAVKLRMSKWGSERFCC